MTQETMPNFPDRWKPRLNITVEDLREARNTILRHVSPRYPSEDYVAICFRVEWGKHYKEIRYDSSTNGFLLLWVDNEKFCDLEAAVALFNELEPRSIP